jgi:hypothetical protein
LGRNEGSIEERDIRKGKEEGRVVCTNVCTCMYVVSFDTQRVEMEISQQYCLYLVILIYYTHLSGERQAFNYVPGDYIIVLNHNTLQP